MPRPSRVRRIAEILTALFLLGASLHAPGSTLLVLGAALLVGGWAWLIGAVGPSVHRVGLVVVAVVLVGLTVLTGRLTDLAVSGPLLFAAIVLAQLARSRPNVAGPAPAQPRPTVTSPPADTSVRGRRLARRVGEAAGRTGTVVTNSVERGLPVGARRAGRLVGRMAARRSANNDRSH